MNHPQTLKRFIKLIRPYGIFVALATFAGMARYLIPLCIPWSIKIIIDDILGGGMGPESLTRLNALMMGLMGLYVAWLLLNYVRVYYTGMVGNWVIYDLREKLFAQLQRLSLTFFENKKIGSIVSRLTHDVKVAQQLMGHGVTSILMDLTSILVIATIMLHVHVGLTLLSFLMIPFYMLVSRHFSKRIRKTSHQAHEKMEDLSGYLHEQTAAMSLTRAFNAQEKERKNFRKYCKDHLEAMTKSIKQQATGLSVAGWISAVAPLIVIWVGAAAVMKQTLTLGEFVAFYGYIGLLYAPVARLTEFNVVISSSLAALDRIFTFLDYLPDVRDQKNAVKLSGVRGKISFQNVDFAYSGKSLIIKNFNLTIQPEEVIALTGASGSGKTTLMKLLLRFYDVNQGGIMIDDHNVKRVTQDSLHRQIALVGQEPILLSGTIEENIHYGRSDISEKAMVQAAKSAHVHDFIMSLPRRYRTQVGERGVRLSAGEKQRIAIARAFLKNAPILILDEPTSALDEVSEKLVTDSLQVLREGRTTLIISHRNAALENVDRTICLDAERFTPLVPTYRSSVL